MAEHSTLGQNVPKSPAPPEGLFLMDGIEGLRSLPQHSVDMEVLNGNSKKYENPGRD